MSKKLIAIILCLVMVSGLVACSSPATPDSAKPSTETKAPETAEPKTEPDSNASAGAVKITFLNTKGEIQAQLEEMAKVFKADTGIELEIVPCPAGSSPFEKMTSMYAAGNAPTLSMMDTGDFAKFEEKMLDLAGEKWTNDALPGSLDVAKVNGKMMAFPFAVEGFGLIYNKSAIEKATGKEFDPASITNRAALEALFTEIKAGGIAPMIISPLDWSLAAHYSQVGFSVIGKDFNGINTMMADLKSGNMKLGEQAAFNSLFDTFDLLAEYNIDKDDPLSGTYDTGAEAVATGKSAFWFMGNWAWPQINSLKADGDVFGFIPVPVDMDGEANKLSAGPTKYVAIDQAQNSPEQIEAAKTFLNWIVYEENGQKGLVETCSIIPAFLNIDKAPADDLAVSILDYMAKDQTLQLVSTFPSDYWKEVGAYMQKHLAGFSTREEMYGEMEAYWKNAQ